MKVVIIGARKRSEREDEPLIEKLLESLEVKYPELKIVSTSCDRGVGKIIKNRCLPGDRGAKPKFNFIEVVVRVYLKGAELTKSEFADIFISRNATLNEMGDEFHILADGPPRGMIADLLQRVRARGAPHALYGSNDREPKRPEIVAVPTIKDFPSALST